MGPIPIRMRLSCNFVNVYTIDYRVQYTFTRVQARIPNGQPCEDPRAEVGEDVRVGVAVGVGPMEFKLYRAAHVQRDMVILREAASRTECNHQPIRAWVNSKLLHRPTAAVNKKHLKNVWPIRYCKPFYIVIHQVSPLPPLSHAACASMFTTTTTTTRDRGDRYGPMEWAQLLEYM